MRTKTQKYLSGLLVAASILTLTGSPLVQAGETAVDETTTQQVETAPTASTLTSESAPSTEKTKDEATNQQTATKEEQATTTEATLSVAPANLDDSKVQAWMAKQNLKPVQTLFRTDLEGKEIHDNVEGYQSPKTLTGYVYLSTITTMTDKGLALVHLYQDPSYTPKAVSRTEYIDATSGKKLHADQTGLSFLSHIGQYKYYNGLIVEEDGQQVYKVFYLTEEDYIAYAGSQYYVRLTDYTKFIDQATGQEISPRQDGFVPSYEISGYTYQTAEIVEEGGVSYFVQSFSKNQVATKKVEQVETKSEVASEETSKERPRLLSLAAVEERAVEQIKKELPFTGDTKSILTIFGILGMIILAYRLFKKRWLETNRQAK